MNCNKCKKDFPESEIDESHDIPKYMEGTDLDGRHWLCKECHAKYEFEVLKIAFMNLVREKFPKEWKDSCRRSAHIVKRYWFKDDT